MDNVLEVTVVTADGEHLTANSHQNQDLFWALRGGGGGTFGVATSVTYRSHPNDQVIAGTLATTIKANTTSPSPMLIKLVAELFRHSSNLTDGGWGGYAVSDPAPTGEATALHLILVAPNVTWVQANQTFNLFVEDLKTLAASSGGIVNITNAFTVPFESYRLWVNETFTGEDTGVNTIVGSRLIPKTLLESNAIEVAEALLPFPGASF